MFPWKNKVHTHCKDFCTLLNLKTYKTHKLLGEVTTIVIMFLTLIYGSMEFKESSCNKQGQKGNNENLSNDYILMIPLNHILVIQV
jgi:hypothetical protein